MNGPLSLVYALVILALIPLYGWWLYRQSRPLTRLAAVLNDHDVGLGFMGSNGEANSLLLFSDVTFVFWLLRRRYIGTELPPAVIDALDEARRAYLTGLWPHAVIIALVFVAAVI